MKTIKTRIKIKDVKVLNKSANLSVRMKNAYLRTKKTAEETQKPHNASPAEYASENVQSAAQGAAREITRHLKNPREKARRDLGRAKGHFQEAKRQLLKERQRAAEQAKKTAEKMKTIADGLKRTADHAKQTVSESKKAVNDAKQNLREIRMTGRQAMREVKPDARFKRNRQQIRKFKINEIKSSKTYSVPKVKTYSVNYETLNITQLSSGLAKRPEGVNPSWKSNAPPLKSPALVISSPANTMPASAIKPDAKQSNISVSNASKKNITRPNYLKKGVQAPKNTGNPAKTSKIPSKVIKPTVNNFKETSKNTVKAAKKSVKTAKKSVKTAQRTAQVAVKSAKMAQKNAAAAAKTSVKASIAATKTAVALAKLAIALTKAAIAALKGLIAAIVAGGGVVLTVVLVICMVGFLISSPLGIFFSGEAAPGTGMTVNSIIAEIDTEYRNRIDDIISSNYHDELRVSGVRAGWKQILAVYTVKVVKNPDSPMEVAVMDAEKTSILNEVFWDMNAINHRIERIRHTQTYITSNGNMRTEVWYEYILHITISCKTPAEMALYYGFTAEQAEWLDELLEQKYNDLWTALLYGTTSYGSGAMIEVAIMQIGNGGELYWSWYGFNSRVEWCAVFLSWVADQLGYIEADIIPRFSWCDDGIRWFRERGQWQPRGYIPAPGDIIFFDWNGDGVSDHVGIVEFVEGHTVHTIEGNTSDSVARRSYRLDNSSIQGYGLPAY